MGDWVIQIAGAIVTLIVSYTILRQTVSSHEEKLKAIDKEAKDHKLEIDSRLDAGVKRFEELQLQISQHIDIREADKKYASKELLDLHIRTIEKDIREVKESNVELGKKLDKLTDILSTNIARTITPHNSVYGGN